MTTPADLPPIVATLDDAGLAAALAGRASSALIDLREAMGHVDPAALKDAGDRAAHDIIVAALASARPDDAVLSEEGADDPARLHADRVWIVDPLDGTREFSEPDRVDFAVHVALWERRGEDGELVTGSVALPGLREVLTAGETQARPRVAEGPWRVAVSRTRAPEVAEVVAKQLDARLVALGSAGYKVSAVLLGEVDAYVHAGGQYEWDSAAPVAVARAAGLHASRLDGSPLRYNRPDPRLPDLLISRPELADEALAAVRASGWTPQP